MKLERKMLYLNALYLVALGAGFAVKAAPLPAYAPGKPWEALASEHLLGMTIGGVGLALWLLRRLDQPRDFKRLTLGWLVANFYVGALIYLFVGGNLLPSLHPERVPRPWGLPAAMGIHAVLAAGFCATAIWRKGTEFRRVFQILLLAEAAFATLVGYGFVAAARWTALPWSPDVVLRFLGIELGGLAAALLILGNPAGGDDRRRLLLGLGAGNAAAAAVTLLELNVWGFDSLWAWGLVLAQVALASGSVWAGLRPERARFQPSRRAMASRLTVSHLLAGAVAGSLALAAPALSLPGWVAFLLSVLLALVIGAVLVGDLQRELLTAARPAFPAAVPDLEEEASRQTWLRQVSEAAAQEERNRLARDLHDSIKQQLFSINVGTAAAQERWEQDPVGARKALADVRRSAREAMVEMQAMLHQLRPEALGTAGLIEALREQCEALGYRTGAEVALELGDPIPDERLPPGAQETLFRIAQEALANVARHARARKVRVRLGCEEEAVYLQVEDDGQGFVPGLENAGMGLRNLRERTESLDGHLDVASGPGDGTRVSLRVPLTAPTPATPPPLVDAIRTERRDWLPFSLLVAIELLLRDDFLKTFLVLMALSTEAWKAWALRSLPRRFPGTASQDVSRLQYFSLRNRALLLWGGGLAAGQELLASRGPMWMLAGLLCLALAVFETARYHRWSRPRPWPAWVWPSGWERPGCSAIFLAAIALALAVPLSMGSLRLLLWQPDSSGALFLSLAAFVYLLWRRPRPEGASS